MASSIIVHGKGRRIEKAEHPNLISYFLLNKAKKFVMHLR